GEGMGGGLEAGEPYMAVRVREKLAAQIHVGLGRVLILVKSFRGGMPDVDFRARDRVSAAVPEPGIDEQGRPRRGRTDDAAAVWRHRRMHAPEWAEQILVGFAHVMAGIIDETHQRRDAE